jgi:pimeloyl-ACP methyl ester carboxylesterase
MATAPARQGERRSRWGDYGPPADSEWRRVDWREHQRSMLVDGRRVNLVDLGDGPAVVFVHGLGSNWQAWLENIPHLAADHRVIAVDLPGFGFSEMPREPISIERYAHSVATVMEQSGVEQATVVGNSMGGFVGAEMAIALPERVERLVLVSAAVLWNEQWRARPLVLLDRMAKAYGARLAAQWEFALRRDRLRLPALAWAGVRHPRAIPLDLAYEIMRGSGADGFSDALGAIWDYKLRERLPEIEAPTLIVWGSHDPLVRLQHAFELERLIDRSRVVVFPDTGHEAMFERPARFNALMDAFLADDADAVARISA